MLTKKIYNVIGIMSGTSLDGTDIALCKFTKTSKKWTYQIIAAETISYNGEWQQRLNNLENETALNFALTNINYGHYLGKQVNSFLIKRKLTADFIASHGHTIFHQPQNKLTSQIGNGASLSAECNLSVVCDFRTKDVALGGQGAPLVPIGDEMLFSEYTFCLNLGGFANISFNTVNKRTAFDICPVNIVLNFLSKKLGKKFDPEGSLAQRGQINEILLKRLNALPYYKKQFPKSLGKEWVVETVLPLLKKTDLNPFDLLRTFTEHVAIQIAHALLRNKKKDARIKATLLVTGGGVYNSFLMERIKAHYNGKIIIPDKNTIEFKEALIFAFLGVLRWNKEVNCLKSVTGARLDSIGGCIYL